MTDTPQNTLLGIFWMLVTVLSFVAVTALVKLVGPDVPPAQGAFLRYVIGFVFVIPMIPALRRAVFTRRSLGMFAARGAAHTLAVICWFYAMTRIPIAEVTAMNYLNPIYVTILAAIFLREHLAGRRIAAIAVALVGAMIILRPGMRELNSGHLAMVFTAMGFAASYIVTKVLSEDYEAGVIVGMLSVVVTIGLLPFALMDWVWPSWGDLGLLTAVAGFATLAHYTMTLAFRCAPLTVTQPVTFVQLVFATTLGVLVFDEPVDIWVILGGALIVSAISFMTWREAVAKRRQITPGVHEAKG